MHNLAHIPPRRYMSRPFTSPKASHSKRTANEESIASEYHFIRAIFKEVAYAVLRMTWCM